MAVDREPTYRRWSPWVYAAGALLGAAGMVWWLFSGDEVPVVILLVLPASMAAVAYRALPTGHTRLGSGN